MMRTLSLLMLVVCGGSFLVACNEPIYEHRTLSSWRRDLKHRSDTERRLACEALGAMGPAATDTIPDLIARFEDPMPVVRDAAQAALEKMGTPALQALAPLLAQDLPVIRLHATLAILGIQPTHIQAMAEFVKFLSAPASMEINNRIKRKALALGADFLPKLMELIQDPYPPARLQAIQIITEMGKTAAPALELIKKRLDNETDARIRQELVMALKKVGTKETIEPKLRELMKDKDPNVAGSATDVLVDLGVIIRTPGEYQPRQINAEQTEEGQPPAEEEKPKPLKSLLSVPQEMPKAKLGDQP